MIMIIIIIIIIITIMIMIIIIIIIKGSSILSSELMNSVFCYKKLESWRLERKSFVRL